MTTQISGTTGVSRVQDGSVVQADLAANVAGNGPAFIGEYLPAIASTFALNKLAVLVATKNEGAAWSNSTDRFQPTIAGYYLAGFGYMMQSTTLTSIGAYIYLNGTKRFEAINAGYAGIIGVANVFGLVYLNGTTDYIEFYTEGGGTGTPHAYNLIASCVLVRAA